MRLTVARILLRVIGTFAGLLGVGMLMVGLLMLKMAISKPLMMAMLIPGLALGAYAVYVGYAAWGQVTPVALRNVCRVLALFMVVKLSDLVEWLSPPPHTESHWSPFAFLGGLFLVYLVYKFTTVRLNQWLFPNSDWVEPTNGNNKSP